MRRSSCKVPLCWSEFEGTDRNVVDGFAKYTQISNFLKIRLVGAELFTADDGRTDTGRRDDANSHFSHFCGRTYKPTSQCCIGK
jgi:hypothetical protein